jgi:hypothetical protein
MEQAACQRLTNSVVWDAGFSWEGTMDGMHIHRTISKQRLPTTSGKFDLAIGNYRCEIGLLSPYCPIWPLFL